MMMSLKNNVHRYFYAFLSCRYSPLYCGEAKVALGRTAEIVLVKENNVTTCNNRYTIMRNAYLHHQLTVKSKEREHRDIKTGRRQK